MNKELKLFLIEILSPYLTIIILPIYALLIVEVPIVAMFLLLIYTTKILKLKTIVEFIDQNNSREL